MLRICPLNLAYLPGLSERPSIVVGNKSDLANASRHERDATSIVIPFSVSNLCCVRD